MQFTTSQIETMDAEDYSMFLAYGEEAVSELTPEESQLIDSYRDLFPDVEMQVTFDVLNFTLETSNRASTARAASQTQACGYPQGQDYHQHHK